MNATPKMWLESIASEAASGLAGRLKGRRGPMLRGGSKGGVERLENRVMFTYTFTYGGTTGPQTVNESGGNDSFVVTNNGFGLLEWSTNNGASFSTQWGPVPSDTLDASPAATLTINLGSDNSAIVDGVSTAGATAAQSASAVQARLHVNAAASNTGDSLTIDDTTSPLGAGTYNYTGNTRAPGTTISGPLGDIDVTEGPNAFGGGVTIVGSDSNNTINVASTYDSSGVGEPLSIAAGNGTNVVNVGNSGSLADINAAVSVTGTATVNVDDHNDTTNATATLDNLSGNSDAPYEVAGLSPAPIEYGAGVTAVNIDGGTDGGSGVTFAVNNTQNGTTTTITGGPNQNFINLANASESGGLDNLPGAVAVQGGVSFADVVTLNDSSADFNDSYTVTSTTVSRVVFGGLTYDDNIGTLTLDAENTLGTNGNSTININSTADFVTTNISGQGGDDTINVNNTGVYGALNVTAGTGAGSTVNVVSDYEPVDILLPSTSPGFVNIGSTGGPGTMNGIQGAISIIDGPSNYALAFHDENNATPRTWTLDNNSATSATVGMSAGIATVSYRPEDLTSALTINGGSGGNTFDVNGTAGEVPTDLYTGTGDDTVNVYATGGNTLNIDGQNGQDAVNIGGVTSVGMQDLSGTINVSNDSETSALTLDDSQDATGQSVNLTDDGTTGSVNGLSPATINYTDADTSALTILGGAGGNIANVLQTDVGTATTLDLGAGANTVDVGPAGSLAGIDGTVAVTGPAALNVDDSNDTASGNATLDDLSGNSDAPYEVAGLSPAPIEYGSGVTNLQIDGGTNGANGVTFRVGDTQSGTTTTIDAGANQNVFNVGAGSLAGIDGTVVLLGPSTLNVDDSSDTSSSHATLDNLSGNPDAPYEVTGLSPDPIEYGPGVTAENIDGGTDGGSGVTFAVNNTQSTTTTTITGGPNQNFINLANASETAGLDNLPGPVVVDGGSSLADVITLNDSSTNFNDSYTVTSTTVSRIVFGGLTYDHNIGTLTLDAENTLGTNGNNTIDINGTANNVTTNVNGQGGDDTITVNGTGTSGTLNVSTGTVDGNTVNVVADSEPVNISMDSPGGNDAINIGSAGGAGTMAAIQGPIGIIDGPGFYQLDFHDENDTTGNTWTLDDNDSSGGLGAASVAVSGIATTSYRPGDLASPLTINGGSGGNTFNVNNTTGLVQTDLNTGTGNDTVNVYGTGSNTLSIDGQDGQDAVNLGGLTSVGMQDLNGTINISNDSSTSALTLDDSQDATGRSATLNDNGTSGTVTGLAPATINYTDAQINALNILGGSGTNTFNVNGDPANSPVPGFVTTLNSGSGASNVVNVAATSAGDELDLTGTGSNQTVTVAPNGSVTQILGTVNADEAPASTALTVNMANDALDHALELSSDGTTSTLHDNSGSLPSDISYNTAALSSLTINTDGSNNQVLDVDFGEGGNPIPALFFNAGAPAIGKQHVLAFTGQLPSGAFASETVDANDPDDAPATNQYGFMEFDDGSNTRNVWYTGLTSMADIAPAVNYTFNDFGNDNSFSATDGPIVLGAQTIEFDNTPASGAPTFQPTDIANKSNVSFTTMATVGLDGTVNIPVASAGLASLTFNTPNDSQNGVTFAATPSGVVTALIGGTNEDSTTVDGAGVAAGTVLQLKGGAGINTLNYDAGGMNPTVVPGLSPGEVIIFVPGAGSVDAVGYQNVNITDTAPANINPTFVNGLNAIQGVSLPNATVGSFMMTPPIIGGIPTALPASDFTASINWGDGSSVVPGTVSQDGSNPNLYYVTGSHTFSEDGVYSAVSFVTFSGGSYSSTVNGVSVSVTVPQSNSMAEGPVSVNVSQATLALSVLPVVGTEGLPIASGPIASFIDGAGPQPIGDYSAVISITNAAGFSLVEPAQSISEVGSSAQYTISAPSISLPEDGTYTVAVSVTAVGGQSPRTVSGTGTALIVDAPLTAGAAVDLAANTGAALTDTEVGSFADANPTAPLSDFTAVINWGDGTASSPGTISQPGGVGTPFQVTGSHVYATPGNYNTQISVTDVGGSTATLPGMATVTDLPVTGSTRSFTTVAGQNSGQFELASFEDPNTLATVSDVNAKLAVGGWGDGTPSNASTSLVVQQTGVDPSNGDPIFEVMGSHVYNHETPPGLPDTLSVIITTLGGDTTTLTSPPGGGVTVTDAPLTGSSGNQITGIIGNSTGSVLLGTFVDASPASAASDFTTGGGSIVINWGDGTAPQTLTSGNLTAVGTSTDVTWAIDAAHTYTGQGTYAYTVTVTDAGGSAAIVSGSAAIADAALTAGTEVDLAANTGVALPDASIGSFTDADPLAPISDFTAVVNWGDGTASSPGTISQPGGVGTPFQVTGSHVYSTPGNYNTQISVADAGGSTVTLTGMAAVTDLPVTGAVNDISAVAGQNTGTVVLATFTDPNPLASVTSVSATLAAGGWGDGTPASSVPLAITAIGGTTTSTLFEVTGSHAYAQFGTYTVNISVTTGGGVTTILTPGTATVADASLTSGSGDPVTATLNAPAANFTVATFNDGNPRAGAADFSATVTATSSSGQTVTGTGVVITRQGSSQYAVSADLAFTQLGTWSIATVVTDLADSQALISTTASISPSPVTITLTTPALTYDGTPRPATATTAPSGVPVSFTYDGSSTEPADAGTYSVVASSADPDYAGSARGTIVIARATPVIAITAPAATYDGAAHGATAVVTGVNGGANPGTATLTYFAGTGTSGTPLSGAPTDAGTYTVQASYAGSTDYSPLMQTAMLTIALATPAITITAPNVSYNGAPQPVTVTVSGVANGAVPGPATVTYFAGTDASGTPLDGPPSAVGTYTVQAAYGGSSDYTPFYATAVYTIFSLPTITPISGTGVPGSAILLAPTASSTDGGALSYSVLTQPAFGSVSVVEVGGAQQFLYQPGAGAFTSDSFTYQATDSLGGTATGTAAVSYSGVGLVASSLNPGAKDLVVVEPSGNHAVTFANAGNARNIKVTVDGVAQGTYTVTGRIFGFAPSGNDVFNASSISRSLWLYGGTGNNTFIGGSGPDVLIGGTGNDYLNGRTGRDILIGGGGTNTLVGSTGTDILIAGSTLYDAPSFANQASLLQILTAWQTSKTVPNIPTVGSGFAGSTPALDDSTITSADTGDILLGNKKSWFFGNFTFNGGTDVFNDGRHIKPNQYLTPLKTERVTDI